MKKVLLIVLMLQGVCLNAQTNSDQQYSKWSINLLGGGSLLPDFENQLQNNFKLGINSSIAGNYKLNKYLGFKVEACFSQRGKSFQYTETDHLFTSFNELIGGIIDTSITGAINGYVDDGIYSTYNGYHKLSYLELPLLTELSYKKFKISAGPYIGLLIKSYTKQSLDQDIPLLDIISPVIDSLGFASFLVKGLINSTFPGYNQTYVSESTSSSIFTKINFGLLVQLSFEIYEQTYLNARFSRNLNNYLIDGSNTSQLSNFSIGISYHFKLKNNY
ncbi:MAG TPA: outer membrane beta-barrel protein [Bacteroidia bacterium]|nr:outer membrane beta-barrel protein [Bacteroidia bacterium]